MAVIESWAPGYQPFRGFAIARALYQEVARLRAAMEAEGNDHHRAEAAAAKYFEELDDLQRTFDLRWKADMRAIKRWQEAHPGKEVVWPDRADLVVWLLEERDQYNSWAHEIKATIAIWRRDDEREQRALAAVPCSAGLADCHAPYYRHFHCCNLRVALWPGEEFPTDYLPDEGYIHLFEPGRGNEPRVSAGCVRLIEPTAIGWLDAVNEHEDVPQSIREAGNRPMQGGPVV